MTTWAMRRVHFTPEQMDRLRQRRNWCYQEAIVKSGEHTTRINNQGQEVVTTWGALNREAVVVYDELLRNGYWEKSLSTA
jgi:hypothetical protein